MDFNCGCSLPQFFWESFMQNIYDNKKFFNEYIEMRDKEINANNLIEKPVFKSLIPYLKDKKVGVAEGSTSKEGLIKAAEQHGVTLSDTNNFQTFPDYPSIKAALDAGQVQAFCVDGSILAGYLDSGTHLLTSIRFMPQQYGIVTKLANKELAAFVNECIETWLADGTIKEFIEDNNVPPSFNE